MEWTYKDIWGLLGTAKKHKEIIHIYLGTARDKMDKEKAENERRKCGE